MLVYLLGALLYLAVSLSQLHVIVTYDGNHDGESEGVGPQQLVALYQGGALHQIDHTDNNSAAFFFVPEGAYTVEAYIPPTRLFFEWVCRTTLYVESDRILELRCFEHFVLRLPFAGY